MHGVLLTSAATILIGALWYTKLLSCVLVAVEVGLWEAAVVFVFETRRIVSPDLFWQTFEYSGITKHREVLEKENLGLWLEKESVGLVTSTAVSCGPLPNKGEEDIQLTFYVSNATLYNYPHLIATLEFGDVEPRVEKGSLQGAPVIVFLHGGGYVYLSTSAYDKLLRQVANNSDAVIVSVDYRQPPKSPFPIPLDDSSAAIQWLKQNSQTIGLNMSKFGVLGDSAGANIAISILASALDDTKAHGWGGSVAALGLIYPMICHTECYSASRRQYSDFFFSKVPALEYFSRQYLGNYTNDTDWRAHVALIPKSILKQFPPTFITAVTRDTLRDEALSFHKQLRAAQVRTDVFLSRGIHGLFGSPERGGKSQAFNWMISSLAKTVVGKPVSVSSK